MLGGGRSGIFEGGRKYGAAYGWVGIQAAGVAQIGHDLVVDCFQHAASQRCLGGRAKAYGYGHAIAFSRSEEHTSELQSLMRISYAVFCLKPKNNTTNLV